MPAATASCRLPTHSPGRAAPSPQHNRLNYFLIDRGPNSAMGAKVEGFRGECLCCKSHDQLPGEGCVRGELCRGACAANRVTSCLQREGEASAAACPVIVVRASVGRKGLASAAHLMCWGRQSANPPCLQMPTASSCTCGTLWGSGHLRWPWLPATWWVQRPAVEWTAQGGG